MRVVVDVIVRPLFSLKGHDDQRKFLRSGRKQMSSLLSKMRKRKNPQNYALTSLTLLPRKVMEKILEAISKNTENENVIWSNLHGFMKGKLSGQPDSLL